MDKLIEKAKIVNKNLNINLEFNQLKKQYNNHKLINPECRYKVIVFYYILIIIINRLILRFSSFINICLTFSTMQPIKLSILSYLELFDGATKFLLKYQNCRNKTFIAKIRSTCIFLKNEINKYQSYVNCRSNYYKKPLITIKYP